MRRSSGRRPRSHRESAWARDGRTLFAGATLARPLDAFRGVLVAAILGPAAYGTWQAILLFWTWAGHFHLGAVNVVERELPMALRLGEVGRARRLRDVAAITTVLMAAAAAGVAALQVSGPAWWVALAAAPLHAFWLLQGEILRAERAFSWVSRGVVAGALLLLVAAPVGAWLQGVAGVVAAVVLQRFVLVLYQGLGTEWSPSWLRPLREISGTIRAGLGYWVIVLVGLVYASADRLLVLALLTRSELGWYGLALALTVPFRLWARALEDALRPRILATLASEDPPDHPDPARPEVPDRAVSPGTPERPGGETRSREPRRPHPPRPRRLPHTGLFLLAQGLVILLAPAALDSFLPAYAPAATATILLAAGAGLWLAPVGAGSLLLGLDRQRDLQLVVTAAALANGLTAWILLQRGWGVTGAAIAVLLAEATRSTLTLLLAWRAVMPRYSGLGRLLLDRALPTLLLLLLLVPTTLIPAPAFPGAALRFALFTALAALTLWTLGGSPSTPAPDTPAARFLARLRGVEAPELRG